MVPALLRRPVTKISIHAPRAGGDDMLNSDRGGSHISIHAPRAGGDEAVAVADPIAGFISIHAPRAGGDRGVAVVVGGAVRISIHAPRAGGDYTGLCCKARERDFNPRPPCGGRLLPKPAMVQDRAFQSTPPVRGATCHRP